MLARQFDPCRASLPTITQHPMPHFFPIITDPWFYALGIPAALLIGLAKSGMGQGFGILSVPLMALSIPAPQAAAILMPVLFAADMMGLKRLFAERDKRVLRLLLPAMSIGVVAGTFMMNALSSSTIAGLLGALTLVFLAQRLLFPPSAASKPAPRWVGFILGIFGGFASLVGHAAGPPIYGYMIPMKLPPVRYVATTSTLFAIMNLVKWIPFVYLGLVNPVNMATGIALLPFSVAGVIVGLAVMRRVEAKLFYDLVYVGMFVSGVKLMWDAFA